LSIFKTILGRWLPAGPGVQMLTYVQQQLTFCSLAISGAGTTMRSLWQEYEDAQTPEAKLVKDFDKAGFTSACS
jgi:hypothetical protein